MKKTLYWVWFSRINNLGSIRKQELLKRYKIEEIWNLDKEELIDSYHRKLNLLRYGMEKK